MLNQAKKILGQFKEFWEKQTKKRKIIMLGVIGGIVLVSVIAAVLLNSGKDGYVALYTGLEANESIEIYRMLQDLSVPARIDSSGQILVLERDKDMLLIQLAALGYPKSTLSYDIFTNNAGLTTTEFEKKQYLLFQLQERIADTIKHIEGVRDAIVTLVIPEESSYVWNNDSNQKSSASVLITMKDGVRLSSDKIAGIKNLIASAVPKMSPEDVILVDAATSLEMVEDDNKQDNTYNLNRLDFESQLEQNLVNKVKEVLSLAYSENEMRVAATVVIDYSRMITEQMEYKPEENGQGVPYKLYESYKMDPEDLASGIPGEETNTDVPIYVDSDDDGKPDTVYYVRDVDYFVSYIKQQIEKDNTQLVDASIAVSLKDGAMTERKRQNIISLVSDATNVPEENITVFDLMAPVEEAEPPAADDEPQVSLLDQFMPFILIGAGVLASLIVILIIVLIVMRSIRKRKARKKSEAEELEEQLQEALRHEEEEQRRKLRGAALASLNQENKITEEVKQFANENPEITASLIRSWLKEAE